MIKIKDPAIKAALQLGFLFLIIQLLIWLFFWKKLPSQVPLFYSRPWGVKQLVSPITLTLLPILSLLVTLINFFLSSTFLSGQKLAGRLLAIFAALFNFLCLVTLLKIIILVT